MTPEIQNAIADYPSKARAQFEAIRALILAATDIPLSETLKWGVPSYLPVAPRTGSTLRLCWSPKRPDAIGLYVHCQSTLAAQAQQLYPDTFTFDGERAMFLPLNGPLPDPAISHIAAMTFTYHLSK